MVVDNYGYIDYQEACTHILDAMNDIEAKYDTSIITHSDTTSGAYDKTDGTIHIGIQSLDNRPISDKLYIVDAISIVKQCFHESRHWQQYNYMFKEKDSCGLDENVIQHMAKQNCVNDIFHDYSSSNFWDISENAQYNYYHLSSEMDAECYALEQVRDFFQNELDPVSLDYYILAEVRRRNTWFMDTTNMSLDDVIDELHKRLQTGTSLTLDRNTLNIPIKNCRTRNLFCSDEKNVDTYFSLPITERDSYLIDYANQCKSKILKMYPIITHDLPPVSIKDKITSFGKRRHLFDENDYEQPKPNKRQMSGPIFDVYEKYIAEKEKDDEDDDFHL